MGPGSTIMVPEGRVAKHARVTPAVRSMLRMAGVGVAYYAAARLGLRYALVAHNVTPLWPPTGIALVAFLLWGRRMWPGVAVAAFFVNEPITSSLGWAVATAAGNTVAPAVASFLLGRVDFHHRIDRVRDALSLVVLAALASMAVSATVGVSSLVLSGEVGAAGFPRAWAV